MFPGFQIYNPRAYIGYINGHDEYAGSIRAGHHIWRFKSLYAPQAGFSYAYDSPQAYDRMAEAAVSIGTYYCDLNRRDDLPDWAPPEDTADAINDATIFSLSSDGRYKVARRIPKEP